MLELRQLRYFIAVAEAEHVGRAAERLAISQPPLSRQIQALEAQLGLALFTRERRRLRLTRAGQDFLAQARALLAQAATLEQQARRAGQGTQGRLSLGVVEGALQAGLVQRDLRRLAEQAPALHTDMRSLRSAAIADGLRRGELDAGYAYQAPPEDDPLLASAQRLHEPFVLALPADHALARGPGRRPLSPAQLDGACFVALPAASHGTARAAWLAGCQAGGFTPDVRYEAAELSVVLGLVAAGLGLALVQASCRHRPPPGIAFAELPWLPMHLALHLLWRRAPASAAAQRFVALALAEAAVTAGSAGAAAP